METRDTVESVAHRTDFDLLVSQNPYLSPADREVHAALVVTARGRVAPGAEPEVAQVILVDCSGSMSKPDTKMRAARRATKAAVGALRDGALFAVVEGTERARQVFPERGLAVAGPRTRRAAADAVDRLAAAGGTDIGSWLALAGRLLRDHPTAVRHVILLTDGRNSRPAAELDAVLAEFGPEFTCDARGIGADWLPTELLRVAEALHGTADAVRAPADLVADFTAMTRAAMGKLVPELRVLVRTTAASRLDFLRQIHPSEADLRGEPVDERTTAFTTGSWGAESREYHLRLSVDPAALPRDGEVRVARVDLAVRPAGATGFTAAGVARSVVAHRTDDPELSSRTDARIAHYRGQAELRRAVLAGGEAHGRGDRGGTEAAWGRAVALATRLGNHRVLARLLRLVEVVGGPEDGVVRVRDGLATEDLLSVAVGSTLSGTWSESVAGSVTGPAAARSGGVIGPDVVGLGATGLGATGPGATGPGVACPRCALRWPTGSAYCGGCGGPLPA
ncbi:VWA domain-containing protein [Saccharothrix syringae]|uniref:VWA domain-containing protein n=1 Tax=Saccharothrix syringae TaxID=103733 RepID=A0A5Q0H5R0_SACSY|nr:VWA domain-containing protein [Saccharothrix syringae]QFZ21527.1 VWA domain-containing protein [Saccharothrix syringae]